MKKFLTIVTRCYKRPQQLFKCIRSVNNQTDKDFEQVFIFDDVGEGYLEANKSFNQHKDRVTGRYVLILDDDDLLIHKYLIEDLKQICSEGGDPDLILFRMHFRDGRNIPETFPFDSPIYGDIGSCCWVIKNEIYKKHIASFGVAKGGDYAFITEVWEENYSKHFMNKVVTSIQRIGGGKSEI